MGTSETVEYRASSEVRYAVVLYGGVSLAIYMNGIAQELLQLVRATAPAPNADGKLWWSDNELAGAGPVYRKLGQMLDRGRLGDAGGPVRTRFVVDIITGTSAGGINGVFLAKALAMDRDIGELSKLWVDEGDIAKLLNDDEAADGVRPLTPQHPPLSLLSGQRMLYLLLKALDGVSRTPPREGVDDAEHSPYAAQIDLWITATDLQGRPVSVETYNPERLGDIREADHHTTFHFRYDATKALLDAEDGSAVVNTFDRKYDPMLAFAARCTSSFPGAFQAVQLCDLTDVVTGVSATAAAADRTQEGPEWATPATGGLDPFFADYGGVAPAMLHSFADGGYLDNQPVDLVMKTLPKRRAELPVARRVLLVDPDPGGGPQRTSRTVKPDELPAPEVELTGDRVDLLGTLLKVVTLPRVQTIGGDVEKILALREPCRVRNELYQAIDDALAQSSAQAADPAAPPASPTPSRAAYEALRRAITARDVGEAIARIGFPDRSYPAGSQHHAIATRLVTAWQAAGGSEAPATFLTQLDLGFELRKINFLQGQIGRDMKVATSEDTFKKQADQRRSLDKAYVDAATRARALRFRHPAPTDVIKTLRLQLGAMEAEINFSAPPQEIDDALADRLGPDARLRKAVDAIMADFGDNLQLGTTEVQILEAIQGDARLERSSAEFEAYDEATLPLRDLLPGENDDIEVLRVSPRDTWRLVDDSKQGPKLAGSQVHHFGGFFSDDWRRNDILWGRLDAAERLISALWPGLEDADEQDAAKKAKRKESQRQRDKLIEEAHAAILGDVLQDPNYRVLLGRLVTDGLVAPRPQKGSPAATAEAETVIDALRTNYRPPPAPSAETSVVLGARAARVAEHVGEGLPVLPGPFQPGRVWLGRIVKLAAGLVELALPDRVRSIVGRHLLDVAMIAAVLIIVLGGLVGGPGVTSFGWVLLLVTGGVRLIIALLASWLASGPWKIGVGVGIVVVVGLVVYGLVSWSGWPRALAMLGIGLVLGLLLAALPALARRRAAKKQKDRRKAKPAPRLPIAAIALAMVVLVAIVGSAVGHAHNELGDRICRMDDAWYRTVATRVAVVTC